MRYPPFYCTPVIALQICHPEFVSGPHRTINLYDEVPNPLVSGRHDRWFVIQRSVENSCLVVALVCQCLICHPERSEGSSADCINACKRQKV